MKPQAANQPLFEFKIIDPECKFRVMEFSAHEWISTPYEVNLSLAEKNGVAFSDAIGKEALLEIYDKQGKKIRFFHGILSQFVKTGKKGDFYLYKATLVPDLWRLSLKQNCRIFQNTDTPTIVKEVLDKTDIKSVDVGKLTTYGKREYCVQYRETDLNYISRLLAEVGIFYFFEHTKDDHKLIFGDSYNNYPDITGDPKVTFIQDPTKDTVSTFIVSQHVHTDKVTLRDFRFRDPANPLSKADPESEKDWERYDYPGGFFGHDETNPYQIAQGYDGADHDDVFLVDKTDADAHKDLAKIRREEAELFKEKAEGQSNCPRFTPGFVFELTDHDLNEFNKEYVLLEIVHTGSQPQVLEAAATRYENTTYFNEFLCVPDTVTFRPLGYQGLTGMPPSETFRPLKDTPKPVVKGPQTAIVVKDDKKDGTTPKSPATDDQNVFTDKYGRVKVRFHWERPHKKDNKDEWYHSAWVRVSQAWAGQGWGAMHIPHVGQEVIVDFLEGDPDRPIITGRVYNAANQPHDDMKPLDHKHISGLQDEGGNKLIFDATAGQESVVLHSPKYQSSLIVGGDDGIKCETTKDMVEQVVGYWAEVGCGSKLEALVGFGLEAKFAQVYEIMVGQLVEIFLANKLEIGFGTEIEWKHTKELKSVDADIEHECKKDYKLTAGDGFCIVGGTQDASKNESIINAFADGITLTLGPEQKPRETATSIFGKNLLIFSGIASLLGLVTAGMAKASDGIGQHTGVDTKATTHLFGTLTGAIAVFQAIVSTIIGLSYKDSVEPSYHDSPEAVIGINKNGITLGIKPDLKKVKRASKKISLLNKSIAAAGKGADSGILKSWKDELKGLKEKEPDLWKDAINELEDDTKADSKVMMKKDGAITMNSQGKGKEIEVTVGDPEDPDSKIWMKDHGMELSSKKCLVGIVKDKGVQIKTDGKPININPGTGNVEIEGSKVIILGSEFSKANVTILKNLSVS